MWLHYWAIVAAMKQGLLFYARLMLMLIGLGALPAYAMGQAPATKAPNIEAPATVAPFSFFKDCETCPELVALPAGQFIMGSDERHKVENPAHSVTIGKAFAIGRYEVTFDEWKVCFDAASCGNKMPDDHHWGTGRRPIINVTWWDAQAYIRWLKKTTGHKYRMPSEAEWEYAARAGTTTAYSWGDEATGLALGNCRDCGEKISHQTEPVGSFKPNPWGLYDVHGNVWEWIADCWHPSNAGAPADGSVRMAEKCRERAMRSGSWYYFSKNLRSSWRFKNDARVRSYGIGFRVVRELP